MFSEILFYVLRPRDERPPATESATREEGERRRKARGGTEKERKKEGGKEREKRTPSKPGTQHKPTCDRQTRAVSLGLGKKAGAQRADIPEAQTANDIAARAEGGGEEEEGEKKREREERGGGEGREKRTE